jgi:hypothetical protein
VAPQGTPGCILSTSKIFSRCLCPRREKKRKSAADCSDKFFEALEASFLEEV